MHDQRIDVVLQFLHTLIRLLAALFSFEHEGPSDNTDCERAKFLRDFGDDGRASRSSTTAHSRGDEDHVGAFKGADDFIVRLNGRAAADFGVGARAQAFGELASELNFPLGFIRRERLPVGVGHDELHAGEAAFDHGLYGVTAAAADADHLDIGPKIGVFFEFKHSHPPNSQYVFHFLRPIRRLFIGACCALSLSRSRVCACIKIPTTVENIGCFTTSESPPTLSGNPRRTGTSRTKSPISTKPCNKLAPPVRTTPDPSFPIIPFSINSA